MVKPTYNCSQQELYTACRLGWQSCEQHLTDFINLKARYNATFIKDRLKEVEITASLKDDQARGEQSEVLRINLQDIATICLANWQKLKRYIADAFPDAEQKPRLESAGQSYYLPASQNNWDSMRGLLTNGNTFIEDNFSSLSANENMPDLFKGNFLDGKNKFEKLHQDFLDSEESAIINTENKITANNDIHGKLMTMFLDGQEIFKSQEAIQRQFIFSELMNLVSGTGTAGIKGYITNSKDKAPIVGAMIKIANSTKSATTDDTGKYELNQVAAGKYQIEISAEGYQTKTIAEQEVKVGTMSTLSVDLDKA